MPCSCVVPGRLSYQRFGVRRTSASTSKHWCVASSRQCLLYDASATLVPYQQGWTFQKELVERCLKISDGNRHWTPPPSPPWTPAQATIISNGNSAGQAFNTDANHSNTTHTAEVSAAYGAAHANHDRSTDHTIGASSSGDALILLQHPPVYTLGAGSSLEHVGFDLDDPPHPIYRTERGGEVTYHGPGQLVMYPVLDLRQYQQDLHWYLRNLEEVVIRALEDVSGLHGERIEGLTGVWVGGRKLAAIGVRAKRWVTYHGLALNVTTDLAPFSHITPCGIADRAVGSVEQVLIDLGQAPEFAAGEDAVMGAKRQLLLEYRYALLDAFSEVFGVRVMSCDEMQPLMVEGQHQML